MNRRGFLKGLLSLGAGVGAVQIYPESALELLARAFHKPKPSTVCNWDDPSFWHVYALVAYNGQCQTSFVTDQGEHLVALSFNNPVQEHIRFFPGVALFWHASQAGFGVRIKPKKFRQLMGTGEIKHMLGLPA